MRRRLAAQAKIAGRPHQRVLEIVQPDPIDDHARRERIVAAGDRAGQFQPAAARTERLAVFAGQHAQKLPRHALALIARDCRGRTRAARRAARHRPASSRRPARPARPSWPARRTANSSPWSESGRTCDRGSGHTSRSAPSCRASSTSIRSSMMSCGLFRNRRPTVKKTHRGQLAICDRVASRSAAICSNQKLVVRQVGVERCTTQSR